MMPAAVRIVVTGLPGLEMDVWGQEIPIMATAYGESNGDVDSLEDDLPDASNDNENDGDLGGGDALPAGAGNEDNEE